VNQSKPCPICRTHFASFDRLGQRDEYEVHCLVCGTYEISATLAAMHWNGNDTFGPPHLLAGAMRYRTSRGERVSLDTMNMEGLLESVPVPMTLFDQIDLVVRAVGQSTRVYGHRMRLSRTDYPVAFAADHDELVNLLQATKDRGWITEDSEGVKLTLDGWAHFEDLKTSRPESDQAFVAMWFSPEVQSAWEDGIRPALKSVGYNPMRIDLKQHNGKVDDHIVAEIRRSALVVADFTGHREGVYFEAGLAMGLGIHLIWTCREDHIVKAHFDTRQYNHVLWSTPEELRDRLTARIEATIPGRTR